MNNKPRFSTSLFALFLAFVLISCQDKDVETSFSIPENYTFTRNGESTVSFSGQSTRLAMAGELSTALLDNSKTANELKAMFGHEAEQTNFADEVLNSSSKNIKGKTAASLDYFSSNSTASLEIRNEFSGWIDQQVDEVFPAWNEVASAGVAGQLADGESTRYVGAKGIEYNQVFSKALIGALMTDQILNNYLSTDKLNTDIILSNNNGGITEEGATYTTMEHYWDEGYGYLYGLSQDAANPNATIGDDDSFLNKYLAKVNADEDFSSFADDIFQAFKHGRAAIVARDYNARDEQIKIIKEKVSLILAIRSIYYLQSAKSSIASENYGAAFHDLSEGYGFIYSLQFTRQPDSASPYVSRSEVTSYLDQLSGSSNGFWDVTATTLDEISSDIANTFGITVAQAL